MKYLGVPQSGAQAATVASRNQYGQYYRDRTFPAQPSSVFRDGSQALFTSAAAAWNALSDAERAEWYAVAQPRQGSLGQATGITGRTLFFRQWIISSMASAGAVTAPIETGPRDIADPRVTSTIVGALDVEWSSTSPLPAGPWLVVDVTLPLTAGSRWLPGRRVSDGRPAYWALVAVLTPGFTTPNSIAGLYNGRFGSGPNSGDRVGWRIRSAGARWFELARGLTVVA